MTAPRPVAGEPLVEVVGHGPDLRELVHVPADGIGLLDYVRCIGRGDREVRVDHRIASPWLGHAKSDRLAWLIRQHTRAGFIAPLEFSVQRNENLRGGRPERAFMLARWELWYLAGKSRTPESNAIMVKVAKGFDAAIDFLAQRVVATPAQSDPALEHRVRVLEACVRARGGVLGDDQAESHVEAPLRMAARDMAVVTGRRVQSHHRSFTNALRNATGFNPRGGRWTNFPAKPADVSRLFCAVDRVVADVASECRTHRRALRDALAARQMDIPGVAR